MKDSLTISLLELVVSPQKKDKKDERVPRVPGGSCQTWKDGLTISLLELDGTPPKKHKKMERYPRSQEGVARPGRIVLLSHSWTWMGPPKAIIRKEGAHLLGS